MFIDINPRLVEPANALASGVDLAGALVEVAMAGPVKPQPDGVPGARTHQLLLAVLGAAQGGRRILAHPGRVGRADHELTATARALVAPGP